jgi:signal transduction histidine kinase
MSRAELLAELARMERLLQETRHRVDRVAEDAQAQVDSERARVEHQAEVLRAASEAKDRFLAMLSHELRTPLTPVLLMLGLLDRRPDTPDSLRPGLAKIRRNVELETRLIDDLLDLTRIAHGKLELRLEVLDAHRAMLEVAEMCAADRPAEVSVEFALDAEHHHVLGDAARIRQVFWNLLRNAFQATSPRGCVLVRSWNEPGRRFGLCVIDNGAGIAAGDLAQLFQPFSQGRQRSGRLGLGLTICKAIVEAHGGSIRASSLGAGLGAEMDVELPWCPEAEEPAPRPLPRTGGLRGQRILLVEDDADTADTLAEALETVGCTVLRAASVAEALARARDSYDLIISDISLPDGTGLDLMRRLRSHAPVSGIALSGYGASEDVKRSRDAGFDAHLVKPVALDQLVDAIETSIRGLRRAQ